MDAATDTVGRIYNKGKTFKDYEREVVEGAGTHYTGYLVELFHDQNLRADIGYLLSKGRQHLDKETFLMLKK